MGAIIGFLLVAFGSLQAVIAWLSSAGHLRVGSWFGVRTPSTRESEHAWHAGQAAAARHIGWSSAVMILGGLVLVVAVGKGMHPAGTNLVLLPIVVLVLWLNWKAAKAAEQAASTTEA